MFMILLDIVSMTDDIDHIHSVKNLYKVGMLCYRVSCWPRNFYIPNFISLYTGNTYKMCKNLLYFSACCKFVYFTLIKRIHYFQHNKKYGDKLSNK